MSLNTLELMVADLQDIAANWGQLEDGERESWSLDWGNEMAALRRLAQDVADGALQASEQARYQRLVRTLEGALPTINRLGLRRPPELLPR
jgi:hypothetical protein